MARRGRRPGISLGYGIGVLGALVAIGATVAGLVPALMLGMFMIGFGNSSNQLSRYVAADMYPFHRRAASIGIVVWAATVGAVLGPNLIGRPATCDRARAAATDRRLPRPDRVRRRRGDPVSFVALRPDPYALADAVHDATSPARHRSRRTDLRRPTVAAALIGLVASQVVMVLIMTMTPVHMTPTATTSRPWAS